MAAVSPASTEGNAPRGALVFGADGQLYGTTEAGGTGTGSGYGVAYKIDANGTYTRLAQFDSSHHWQRTDREADLGCRWQFLRHHQERRN